MIGQDSNRTGQLRRERLQAVGLMSATDSRRRLTLRVARSNPSGPEQYQADPSMAMRVPHLAG